MKRLFCLALAVALLGMFQESADAGPLRRLFRGCRCSSCGVARHHAAPGGTVRHHALSPGVMPGCVVRPDGSVYCPLK